MKRFAILVLGLAVALLHFTAAASDPYPVKAVRLVVIYTAGGANDIVARVLGEKPSQALGQPVIIENKPGAAGYVGADYVAKSQPDGGTLLVGGNPQIVGPLLYKAHKLNVIKDFTAVANLVRAPIVLVSAPELPANNAGADKQQGFRRHAVDHADALHARGRAHQPQARMSALPAVKARRQP